MMSSLCPPLYAAMMRFSSLSIATNPKASICCAKYTWMERDVRAMVVSGDHGRKRR